MTTPTLIAILRHGKNHAHDYPMIIDPHQCVYLSPFDINGKEYLPLGIIPLSSCLRYFPSPLMKG